MGPFAQGDSMGAAKRKRNISLFGFDYHHSDSSVVRSKSMDKIKFKDHRISHECEVCPYYISWEENFDGGDSDVWTLHVYEVQVVIDYCPFCGEELPDFPLITSISNDLRELNGEN